MWKRLLLPTCFVATLATATLRPGSAVDPPPPGSFTIAVLPDTQNYSQSFPFIFDAQTQWIRDNRVAHNIVYTLHLGDVTNHNTVAHWDNALGSLGTLDGFVPYAVSPGNHDYGPNGNGGTRDSLFNSPSYFGPGSPYATQPTIGGFYEAGKTDNSYHLFSAGGRDWIVLALEWGPRDPVVAWADQVLDANADRTAIVITHAYMYFDETRYDRALRGTSQSWNPHGYGVDALPGGVNDGQELWDKLIREHDVAMVLNGHVLGDGTGRLASVGDDGQVVHQMLSNYQSGVTGSMNGGDGFMRLLRFLPDGKTVEAVTYSPFVDQTKDEPDQHFTIGLFNDPIESVASRAVLADDPLLYYRLEKEDGPSVTNIGTSASALDGAYVGPGPASEFDGSGQIDLANPPPTMAEWSIAAWVRTDSTASQTVLSNDHVGWNDDVLFGLAPDGSATPPGRWAVSHHDDDLSVRTFVADAPLVELDRWYHVVATSDGDALSLWVDGELVGTEPSTGNDLDFDAASTRVGRSFNTSQNGRPFDGSIAEVALFDRALCATDVLEHRMATLGRVVGAQLDAPGPTDPNTNATVPTLVDHTAFPALSAPGSNEGDVRVALANRGLNVRDGVLLATVTQNLRDNLRASVEVGRNSFSDGTLTLSIMEAGFPNGSNEVNFDVATAWLPFSAGWRGAHVDGDGAIFAANGVDASAITSQGFDGRFTLDLGVDSRTDGMLFTIGGENEDNIVPAGVVPDGSGWDIRVQDNAANFASSGEADNFSFVHVPYDTPGLVGGRYDGLAASHLESTGSFQMVRVGTGRYRLTVTGESPETGMLLLTVSYRTTSNNVTAPDDNVLSYEADLGNFVIESHDLPSLNAQDTQFVWAFVPWVLHSDLVRNYCVATTNTAGSVAAMGWSGSTGVAQNDLTLEVAGAVPGEAGIFIFATGAAQVPAGNGFLCVGGGIFRILPPILVSPGGTASRLLDLNQPPMAANIDAGDTRYFQFWYRDPGGFPSTYNFSDGLEVTFCP